MRHLFLAVAAVAAPLSAQQQMTATGEFDVKVAPISGKDEAVMRLSLNKVFRGDFVGASTGQMMATGGPDEGSGAYVAIETMTGTLHGKKGSFALAHRGTMTPSSQEISVVIVPNSGKDTLTGISGTLDIKIEGSKHFYTLNYSLPAAR